MTRERRGVALVLVLWIIVIAGAITASALSRAHEGSELAMTVRAQATSRSAAESGIAAAVDEIEMRLAGIPDSVARQHYLNDLDHALAEPEIQLGDARSAVALIDPASRLDVNSASVAQLTTFFSAFADGATSAAAATSIRRAIENRDANTVSSSPAIHPFHSLDELRRVPGLPNELLVAAVPYLTADGDGHVNRQTAPPQVRAAAGGDLVDEPSRILLVSRGWLAGHPLTHELQAVYAIARTPTGDRLVLVRWRERDL